MVNTLSQTHISSAVVICTGNCKCSITCVGISHR